MVKKKTPAKQLTIKKKVLKKTVPHTFKQKIASATVKPFIALRSTVRTFLTRRPHRSFRKTLRRDYVRSLKLPGYWAFTSYVRETLWVNRRLFISVIVLFGVSSALFVGLASQQTYTTLSETLRNTSTGVFEGNSGEIGQAALLLLTGATGNFTANPTEPQQIYGAICGLMAWLVTVWLLRGLLAGKKPRLRDGLYSAGSPIIPTFMVLLAALVQLLPLAIAAIIMSAAISTEFIAGGVEAMALSIGALLLVTLSLYWITSTFIAMVVVTLPGMYPMQAIQVAGDLVVGRRLRILFRLLWMVLITALVWLVVMVPVILFDTWLKGIWQAVEWVPLVPVTLLVVGSFTVVWSASYVYLLYRRVVDDDASPA